MSDLTFTMTEQEANVMMAGLAELPAKHSLALIQKLQIQAVPQLPNQNPQPPADEVEI